MNTVPPHAIESKTARIYGMIDPRTQELRYVGRTTKTLEKRLKDHLRDARDLRDNAPRFPWIRELLALVLQPEIFLLEEVPISEMQECEGYWIGYFRYIGANLLNVPYRMGREGAKYRDFVWTEEILARLGKIPDEELGREIGLPRRCIERKRHNLSIPKCGNRFYVIPPMGGWNKTELPQHILARLGTIPDAILGKEIGVSKYVIARERRKRNIPDWANGNNNPTQFKVGEPHPRWDKAGKRVELPGHIVARLGQCSDMSLAKELGIHHSIVARVRKELGIAAIPRGSWRRKQKGGDA